MSFELIVFNAQNDFNKISWVYAIKVHDMLYKNERNIKHTSPFLNFGDGLVWPLFFFSFPTLPWSIIN